jgi:hypothetical protein
MSFPSFSSNLQSSHSDKIRETGKSLNDQHLDFDLEYGDDPVNRYGFGIKSYLDLILWLIGLFTVLSLINIPLMLAYSADHHALDDGNLTGYMLGNLG